MGLVAMCVAQKILMKKVSEINFDIQSCLETSSVNVKHLQTQLLKSALISNQNPRCYWLRQFQNFTTIFNGDDSSVTGMKISNDVH